MEKHPLMIEDGERAFTPPATVQAACKAALAAGAAERVGSAFAKAIAEHIAGGQPISLDKVGRLGDVLDAATADERLAKTAELFGGDAARTWVADVLKSNHRTLYEGRNEVAKRVDVLKVDESLGIVFGWAIVSKVNGVDYFDVQGDNITEAAMLKAAADFMLNSRVLGDMHEKAEGGSVLFAFPLTTDVAKAFGITTKQTGLMIGVKPANAETLAKFVSGEYTGFSIGGRRGKDEDVD